MTKTAVAFDDRLVYFLWRTRNMAPGLENNVHMARCLVDSHHTFGSHASTVSTQGPMTTLAIAIHEKSANLGC